MQLEKEVRDVNIKRKIKVSLYVDHIITYLENPRKSTENYYEQKIQ